MLNLQQTIDQWIFEKELEEDKDRDRDCWSASAMGMCPRMRYWQRQGKQSNIKEPMVYARQRWVGKALHTLLNDILAEKGMLVAGEQELSLGSLRGHFDAIVKDDDGEMHLLDHKTVHSRSLDYISKGNKNNHRVMQLLTYAYLIKELKPELYEKIKTFRLGFLSRDDMRMMDIIEDLTPLMENKIKQEIKYLDECWAKQELPDGPAEEWNCKRCQYRDQCNKSKETNGKKDDAQRPKQSAITI